MTFTLRNYLFCACMAITLFAIDCQADPVLPTHGTARWQDISDISWSVDGTNWGQNAMSVGDTVQFKFTMHKDWQGRHYADFLKAWVDWDNSNTFESHESILFAKHVVFSSPVVNNGPGLNVDEYYEYKTAGVTLTSANSGDHWLLASVTCSESLLTDTPYDDTWALQWPNSNGDPSDTYYDSRFLPEGDYIQGESELEKFTVNPVPEPATLLLFGTGVVGLLGRRLRRKN